MSNDLDCVRINLATTFQGLTKCALEDIHKANAKKASDLYCYIVEGARKAAHAGRYVYTHPSSTSHNAQVIEMAIAKLCEEGFDAHAGKDRGGTHIVVKWEEE
jgi:hypothetical protein